MTSLFLALRKAFGRSLTSSSSPSSASTGSGNRYGVHSDKTAAINSTDIVTKESVTSNAPHFKWMEGRRFNITDGVHYVMPNDATESDRMMLEHFMLKEVFQGRNFHAPIKQVLRAGIKEMATDYPQSTFIGIDISDGFPETIKPNNCEFRIGNIREKLPFEDQSFDYIYIRNMAYTMVQTELPVLFREVYRVLRPGGFVEMVEVDIEPKRKGPQAKIGCSRMIHGFQARGIDVFLARHLDAFLHDNNFINAQTNFGSIPVGWGGKLGDAMQQNAILAMIALKQFHLYSLNYTSDQFDALIEAMKIENPQYESYSNYHYAFASRPLA
ncbi:S-adenosyl-L-methionine-dependent methyltransferase [Endogone sp. FLAS-F59071]|nr:S-adenosyl-L-methionine-dependent methyltransferase [Endogone sp. FLAS-F59071]|eukprot:RUS18993.1 S-adenosyl-L-methionine-dependent methyltransferase [Endogone sp. FLAS-F59071]